MKVVSLSTLSLRDAWYEHDERMRVKVDFPFYEATGNQSTAVVYFEIEPGQYLGTHTDSAEEIVLILQGTVEARLGDEQGTMGQGEAVLIPATVPHSVWNNGTETARCMGFFSAAAVVSTFDQRLMPFDRLAVGTPPVAGPV